MNQPIQDGVSERGLVEVEQIDLGELFEEGGARALGVVFGEFFDEAR